MLEIYRALVVNGAAVRVATHGGTYERVLRDAGVPFDLLGPRVTPERCAAFVRSVPGIGPPHQSMWSDEELRVYVAAEVGYFREHRVRVAVTGWTLTTLLDARRRHPARHRARRVVGAARLRTRALARAGRARGNAARALAAQAHPTPALQRRGAPTHDLHRGLQPDGEGTGGHGHPQLRRPAAGRPHVGHGRPRGPRHPPERARRLDAARPEPLPTRHPPALYGADLRSARGARA